MTQSDPSPDTTTPGAPAASAAARLARLGPAQRAALAARLAAARSGPALRTRPGPRDRFPLGMDQERLWILDELDPDTTTYTLGFGLRFRGTLDLGAFTEAARAVARRHELLRSGIETEDGRPYLKVHADRSADVTFTDVSDGPDERIEERRAAFVAEQVRRPFDLRHDPVLRLAVARVAHDDYQVVETMPHSFTDQWSYVRLNHELIEHYRAVLDGTEPQVPDLPVQFGDYAQWQRDCFAGPKGAEHRAFWRTYLEGAPERLPLPYDATPDTSDHTGEQYQFILDKDVAAAFVARAAEARTTMATAMTAAYVALLHEETGARDIVVGVPSVTRGEDAVQDLIGFLLTNVPIRVRLPENPTPAQVLAATVEGSVAVQDHREVPFGEIVEAAAPGRSVSRYPLLQTMLVQLDLGDSVLFEVPGADVYANAVPEGVSSMDMTVAWWQVHGVMYGRIEYRTALFLPSTVERMARRLLQLVELFATSPDTPLRTRTVPPASPVASVFAAAADQPAAVPADGLERVGRAWCEALGVPRALPEDVFFEVGGTSLLAVRLTHLLKAEGLSATLRDVFSNATLGRLAQVLLARDSRATGEDQYVPVGPLGPEQELLYEAGLERVESFAHTFVLRAGEQLDASRLEAAAKAVVAAHPGLSTQFSTGSDGRRANIGSAWSWRVETPGADPRQVAAAQRAAFDAERGELFALSLIPGPPDTAVPDLVVISANHLVIDGMSWSVVVGDLAHAYRGRNPNPEPAGPLEYAAAVRAVDPAGQSDYWSGRLNAVRPVDWGTPEPERAGGARQFEVSVPLTGRPGSLRAEAFTAVARALRPYTAEVVVSTIGLGREPLPALRTWDPARAVGYYSCPYPLHLPLTGGSVHDDLTSVGTALGHVPDGGKAYGLLRCSTDAGLRDRFARLPTPRIVLNYLGALADPADASEGLFRGAGEFGAEAFAAGDHARATRGVDVDVAVGVRGDQAVFRWLFDPARVAEATVRDAAARAAADLTALLHADREPEHIPGITGVTEEQMDRLFAELSDVQTARGDVRTAARGDMRREQA
ncbi:condensation domain-containing protein [Streptomyces sp. NPDC056656]|uniref:condensation domain-containing protein n=1 Tax=Streptomyces sp. NPDC056656 TaxID=3345895 RepID=UPI00367D157E